MATQNDFSRAFTVSTAMSAFLRVSVSGDGSLRVAGTEFGIGILQEDVLGAAYETPKVRFPQAASSMIQVTGATAVTPGASLYTVAGGYVAITGTTLWGQCLQGSGGTNPVIIEAVATY